MSWTLQLTVFALHGFLSFSSVSLEPCDKYAKLGFPFEISFTNKSLETEEITWKHNGTDVFKRKNKNIISRSVNVSSTASLLLKTVAIQHGGTYHFEVFNSGGTSIIQNSTRLCVQEKLSKPTVTSTCLNEDVTLTCNVNSNNVKTYKWKKNENQTPEKSQSITVALKDVKESDTFTCLVENNVSKETSDKVKIPCKAPGSSNREPLFGYDFWSMVGIMAGGGGLVLLLIVVTLVCCCCRHRQSRFEEEREMRLDLLTQPQPSCHPDGQKQKPRPNGGAPPGSTGPRRMPRARERPPPSSKDDYEEEPPPLPQPRKKGPRPPKQ